MMGVAIFSKWLPPITLCIVLVLISQNYDMIFKVNRSFYRFFRKVHTSENINELGIGRQAISRINLVILVDILLTEKKRKKININREKIRMYIKLFSFFHLQISFSASMTVNKITINYLTFALVPN